MRTTESIAVIILKFEQGTCSNFRMITVINYVPFPIAGGMTNGADPDQTAPFGAFTFGSTLFVQAFLSVYRVFMVQIKTRYCKHYNLS